MTEAINLDENILRNLYVYQGLSVYAIAKNHLHVSTNTVDKYVSRYHLQEEREKFRELKRLELTVEESNATDAQSRVDNEDKSVGEACRAVSVTDQTAYLAPSSAAASDVATNLNDEADDLSLYGQLQPYEQRIVDYFTENWRDKKLLTFELISKSAKVTNEYIEKALKNPNVEEAIKERTITKYKFEGVLELMRTNLKLLEDGKTRDTDRAKLAEQFGLVNGPMTNVQVNISTRDKNIRNNW